jgi:hypothetical protein
LGFEHRGQLNFDSAYNVYLGLPGDGDVLELTVNVGRDEPYDLGEGYNHMALVAEDLDALLGGLAEHGVRTREAAVCAGRPLGVPHLLGRRATPSPRVTSPRAVVIPVPRRVTSTGPAARLSRRPAPAVA